MVQAVIETYKDGGGLLFSSLFINWRVLAVYSGFTVASRYGSQQQGTPSSIDFSVSAPAESIAVVQCASMFRVQSVFNTGGTMNLELDVRAAVGTLVTIYVIGTTAPAEPPSGSTTFKTYRESDGRLTYVLKLKPFRPIVKLSGVPTSTTLATGMGVGFTELAPYLRRIVTDTEIAGSNRYIVRLYGAFYLYNPSTGLTSVNYQLFRENRQGSNPGNSISAVTPSVLVADLTGL